MDLTALKDFFNEAINRLLKIKFRKFKKPWLSAVGKTELENEDSPKDYESPMDEN